MPQGRSFTELRATGMGEAFTLRFPGSAQARVGLVAEADKSWRRVAAIFD
jgi:hypothetical protein